MNNLTSSELMMLTFMPHTVNKILKDAKEREVKERERRKARNELWRRQFEERNFKN